MFAQSIWTISLTVPASPWFTSFTYCRNQSIVILWLTLRLSNQCLSIKLRKSSLVSSTSLCTENTNFIQALESVKNVIKDRHSRPCVSCSKSTLQILKTLDHDALTCSMSVAEVNKLICKAWRCWEHHCFIFADHFSKLLLCLNISNLKYQFNIKYLIIICFIQSVSIRHGPHLCRITSPCLQFGLLCPGL